ncbi:MAG TPA: 1-deoxy-D-xylulose-5-phosphate synthase [candidate division Zixibacteria bacterium]|nr:1-deoxy-D-xylulose-5-phosphate synthase [candidate division Zixibacteria bacterium]
MILERINAPSDLRKLKQSDLIPLAEELRAEILKTVSQTGGHLATNMGAVELTLALHYVFNTPQDKIVWDVGNQTYAHKLITGRRKRFHTLRQYDGLSGFTKIEESEYDVFGAGHASTAISAAFGMACARDLAKEKYKVVAVFGDGSLTGGLAYEGLNNAGASGKDFLAILNDNSMSISKNVGAIAQYLTGVLTDATYNKIKADIWELVGKTKSGLKLRSLVSYMDENIKGFFMPGTFFEKLGFRYFGPMEGHDLPKLVKTLKQIKNLSGPILLHVLTVKGKGFVPAEQDAARFHGVSAFDKVTGATLAPSSGTSYMQAFGETMVKLAKTDPSVVAITAAMCQGTGLSEFAKKYPERFFDVGIAEGHGGTFAAGLAAVGKKPVYAIYSTFLQRAYDQVVHDIALQNLPVVFGIDRAGLVGEDGPTHHGIFDIPYLRCLPNIVVSVPKDGEELANLLYTAVNYKNGPFSIRYPRAGIPDQLTGELKEIEIGSWEVLEKGEGVLVIACGTMVYPAGNVVRQLREEGYHITLANARFIKPLDERLLDLLFTSHRVVLTIEEGALAGGLGSAVMEYMEARKLSGISFRRMGIPDRFIHQGARKILLEEVGLTEEGIKAELASMNLNLAKKKSWVVSE